MNMLAVPRVLRLILFSVWAVVLTAVTYVLGAPALKVLRRRLGRAAYWSIMTFVTVGFYLAHAKLMAIAFFGLVVLIGVFEEFEELGMSFNLSAFFSLLINSLLGTGGFALWMYSVGARWSQLVSEFLQANLKPVLEFNPSLKISAPELMQQLPSIILIAWMIAIYLGVLLEARFMTWLRDDQAENLALSAPMRPQLAALQLPDACVWLLIASVLGAFGNFDVKGLQSLSINVLNVCIVAFFFQGIAVANKFFETLRLGVVWQALLMAILVIQLFLFVSLLGLLDYWLGFRPRMVKRAGEVKRET